MEIELFSASRQDPESDPDASNFKRVQTGIQLFEHIKRGDLKEVKLCIERNIQILLIQIVRFPLKVVPIAGTFSSSIL